MANDEQHERVRRAQRHQFAFLMLRSFAYTAHSQSVIESFSIRQEGESHQESGHRVGYFRQNDSCNGAPRGCVLLGESLNVACWVGVSRVSM